MRSKTKAFFARHRNRYGCNFSADRPILFGANVGTNFCINFIAMHPCISNVILKFKEVEYYRSYLVPTFFYISSDEILLSSSSFQDLVKSHLMSAVRSEVEELRDKISKLEVR